MCILDNVIYINYYKDKISDQFNNWNPFFAGVGFQNHGQRYRSPTQQPAERLHCQKTRENFSSYTCPQI